ncbi:MAG: MoaD/ThiS family protein [Bacteroidota bacterium]
MKSSALTLSIQCFGIAQEICGGDSIEASLPAGSNISDLKQLLVEQYPQLGELRHFFVAQNQAYASSDALLSPADELVIIPPVAGG